jgi:plastocyanin
MILAALLLSCTLLAPSLHLRPSTFQDSAPASETVTVNATDYKFTPRNLNITTGTIVIWINRGLAAHTSTESSTPPVWSSGNLDPGQNYSFLFTQPRVYSYYCGYHVGAPYYMTGTINVTGQPINTNSPGGEPTILPFYSIPLGTAGAAVVLALFWIRRRRTARVQLAATSPRWSMDIG